MSKRSTKNELKMKKIVILLLLLLPVAHLLSIVHDRFATLTLI